MRIALDPTPYHSTLGLLDFADKAAELGYEWYQLTPHVDFLPFFRHPRADDDLVAAVKKRARDAGVGISSLLPMQRLAWPDEDARVTAVRHWRRTIEIAVELEVTVLNTEFSGRPDQVEESERSFYRSLEELLPVLEREGLTVNFDPHPDDFVEDGLEALRVLRGLNSPSVGFVYVASHTFHMGDDVDGILDAAGTRLRAAYAADTMDHRRSHGLRYISNPPGNASRVHQHLTIGDGDVDWAAYFSALVRNGFTEREDSILVSNVFGEDERADEVSRRQLAMIRDGVARAAASSAGE